MAFFYNVEFHHQPSLSPLQIEVGATNVRVGSIIFGNREYPNSAANTPNPSPSPSPAHSPEKTSKVVCEEAAKKMHHLTV